MDKFNKPPHQTKLWCGGKPYNPQEVEEKIYKLWEESGFFNPDNLPKTDKGPFVICLPPPNVTGSLHLGHALNATIQDILIRKKRMEGYKALWIPGTDHAGIATQNVVEKMLKKEGMKNVIPDKENTSDAVDVYYRFYTKEQEKRFGVVVIKIKKIN